MFSSVARAVPQGLGPRNDRNMKPAAMPDGQDRKEEVRGSSRQLADPSKKAPSGRVAHFHVPKQFGPQKRAVAYLSVVEAAYSFFSPPPDTCSKVSQDSSVTSGFGMWR